MRLLMILAIALILSNCASAPSLWSMSDSWCEKHPKIHQPRCEP